MEKVCVAVLGATGAVGREMVRQLERSPLAVSRLVPLASGRQEGRSLWFRGDCVPVKKAEEGCFSGVDFVLGAVSSDLSRQFCPEILRAGAVYIDNSSAFRLEPEVPLVVPEINGPAAAGHWLIANPNCSTAIILMAVAALHQISPIQRLWACTFQAVSGAGQGGIREMQSQLRRWESGEMPEAAVFSAPIVGNVIPQIGEIGETGYTSEECKLQNEGRRILAQPGLLASCTCVRVPVERCHSMAVTVQTAGPISVEQAKMAIGSFPGCVLSEDTLPMPLNTAGIAGVRVGRIRKDQALDNALALWCCGDQLIKGAAGNAVQILEACVAMRAAQ